jgi:glucosamine--fructose-6-phosphate aminotransferase (isomerizing)
LESLGNFPDPFFREIVSQPSALRRAAAAVAAQRDRLEDLAARVGRGSSVVFTGMGASYDACYAPATVLAGLGIPGWTLDAAELLHFRRPALEAGPGSALVVVSQSGRSAEPVRLAEVLPEPRPTVVAVTNDAGSPLSERADVALATGAGPEIGPSTMTFAATLVVLDAVARVLSGEDPAAAVSGTTEDAEAAALAAEGVLADAAALAERLLAWLGDRPILTALARGVGRAAAETGALLLKEAARFPVESLEAGQFRHGPLELAGPGFGAILVAVEEATRDLDLGLAKELRASGAAVFVVTDGPSGADEGLSLGPLPRPLAAAVAVIPFQLLGWRLAVARGLEPGILSRATKVTTRE